VGVFCGLLNSASSADGYLDSKAAAGTINSLKSSPYLAGFGFWSVGYDIANVVTNLTWSQRVSAAIGGSPNKVS
jgi:hypothetical protein